MRVFTLLALALACRPPPLDAFATCEVQVAIDPQPAAPGSTVTLTGGPYSEVYDTLVLLDGRETPVLEVQRLQCDDCEECRAEWSCSPCGRCAPCQEVCALCQESMTLTVAADQPPTSTTLVVINRFGTSGPVPFVVDWGIGPDTGPTDTGPDRPGDSGGFVTVTDTASAPETGVDTAAPGDTAPPGDTAAPGDTGRVVDTAGSTDTGRVVDTAGSTDTARPSDTATSSGG